MTSSTYLTLSSNWSQVRTNQNARIIRLMKWRYPDYWLKCQIIDLFTPPILNTILCPLKLIPKWEQVMVWKCKPLVSLSLLLWVFQFLLHQLPCFPQVFSTDLKHHNFNVFIIKPTKSRSLEGTGTPTFKSLYCLRENNCKEKLLTSIITLDRNQTTSEFSLNITEKSPVT